MAEDQKDSPPSRPPVIVILSHVLPWYAIAAVKWLLPVIVMGFALTGCQSKVPDVAPPQSPETVASDPKQSPDEILQEQLRSGAFQLDAATESIAEAFNRAKEASKKSTGTTKEGLDDIVDYLDGAGAQISDFASEAPSVAEIQKDRASIEKQRAKAIEAINDTIHDLEDAQGIASSIEEESPNYAGKGLADLISVAIDDLKGAIEGFGGKVESDDEDTNPKVEENNSPK